MEHDSADLEPAAAPRPVVPPRDGLPAEPESALWQQFATAAAPREFCQAWLSLHCRMVDGVRTAMVVMGPPDRGPFTAAAVWPDPRRSVTHLGRAAERCLKERRGLLLARDATDPAAASAEDFHIAYPVEVAGQVHGAVVLGVDEPDRARVQQLMRQLHWGAAWMEVLVRRSQAANWEQTTQRLRQVLDFLASAVEHEDSHEAATALVTRIANGLQCDRASIGFRTRRRAAVVAISHSADVGGQSALTGAIEAAMDEAMDQQAVIVYPGHPESVPLIVRAHAELARRHGSGAICTVPLEIEGRPAGALTLERPEDRPFAPETVELCQTVAAIVGPILLGRRREERWLSTKAADALLAQLRRLFGAGHLVRKLVAAGLAGLVVFFAVFSVDHRVTAATTIEGAVRRVVAAPFDGYVRQAPARPGDVVQPGDLLGVLDDRELNLERVRWLTEREQFGREYDEALARQDRAQIRILGARIEQAQAQVALLDEQLARCRIAAPFAGVVMSGDLSQSLGAPVERGQVLFEVAPLDSFRVVAEVDERDVGRIEPGQSSSLVLPSMPGRAFPFQVAKVTPVAVAKEGRTYFRVEGRLGEVRAPLRPGMEGVGKITVGRRRLIWVWTHPAIDWIRLQLWRWLP